MALYTLRLLLVQDSLAVLCFHLVTALLTRLLLANMLELLKPCIYKLQPGLWRLLQLT